MSAFAKKYSDNQYMLNISCIYFPVSGGGGGGNRTNYGMGRGRGRGRAGIGSKEPEGLSMSNF